MRRTLRCISLLFLNVLSILPLFPQHRVDPRNTYERVIMIVPMIGSGTPADPRRPLYAPAPSEKLSKNGIIAYSYVLSDDEKSALVEFVAMDRAAFDAILKDQRTDIKRWEKAKTNKDDVAKEFKKLRKDFNIDEFEVTVR